METSNIFTVKHLAAKCKSKTELYNLLIRDGKIYLPPKQDATQKYLRELIQGKKLHLKWSEVILTKVPQYEGLKVKDLLRFAKSKTEIDQFLPEYSYNKEPNREWLCNMINTLITDEFQEFIKMKVEKRNKEIISSQNLGIKATSEFVEIFKRSQSISTTNGKSHFLARNPKVTKEQQKIITLEEEKKELDSKASILKEELNDLKSKMNDLQHQQEISDSNNDKLSKLYELGIIDENGELIRNDMNIN